MVADLGTGLMGVVSAYGKKDMGGVFKSGLGLLRTAGGSSQKADKWAKENRASPADVVSRLQDLLLVSYVLISFQISWSGCKDSQTSADTVEAGKATGAMSHVRVPKTSH